jgi:hypothetical protein
MPVTLRPFDKRPGGRGSCTCSRSTATIDTDVTPRGHGPAVSRRHAGRHLDRSHGDTARCGCTPQACDRPWQGRGRAGRDAACQRDAPPWEGYSPVRERPGAPSEDQLPCALLSAVVALCRTWINAPESESCRIRDASTSIRKPMSPRQEVACLENFSRRGRGSVANSPF